MEHRSHNGPAPPAICVTVGDPNVIGIREVSAALSPGTSGSVSYSVIQSGLVQPDGSTRILTADATTIEGELIKGRFSDISVYVTEGDKNVPLFAETAYFDIVTGSGILRAQFARKGALSTPGIIELHIEGWYLQNTRYYVQTNAGMGEFAPTAADALVPLRVRVTDGLPTFDYDETEAFTSAGHFLVDYMPTGVTIGLHVFAYSNAGASAQASATFAH